MRFLMMAGEKEFSCYYFDTSLPVREFYSVADTLAMMEESCAISGQKAENRMDIPRRLRYMDVRTAVAVSIKPGAFLNTMPGKTLTGTRS